MKLLMLAALSCLAGCGGINHIPDARSENQWRTVAMAATKAAPKEEAKPPPTEVPFRKISVRGAYVAVFDIQDKSKALSKMELDSLTDYLATKVAEDGLFHVIPREEIDILLDICDELGGGRTICALADGAINPIRSAVEKFRAEFERRIAEQDPEAAADRQLREPVAVHEGSERLDGEPEGVDGEHLAADVRVEPDEVHGRCIRRPYHHPGPGADALCQPKNLAQNR